MKSMGVMSIYLKIEFNVSVLLGNWHTVFCFMFAAAEARFWRGKVLWWAVTKYMLFQQHALWKFPGNIWILYGDQLVHVMDLFGFQW